MIQLNQLSWKMAKGGTGYMKNKLWKQWMMSGLLVSAMVVSCGASVCVQAEETTDAEETASSENGDDLQILFDQAVEDAMIAEDGEILPVVSLDEGEPYAVYDDEGRVLLYTFHKYPDSYPDGADVKLEWGMYGHLQAVNWKTGIRKIKKA